MKRFEVKTANETMKFASEKMARAFAENKNGVMYKLSPVISDGKVVRVWKFPVA